MVNKSYFISLIILLFGSIHLSGQVWQGSGSSSSTLAEIATKSTNTAKSLYTMTTSVDVDFENSVGNSLFYLYEAANRIGVNTNNPDRTIDIHQLDDIGIILRGFDDKLNSTLQFMVSGGLNQRIISSQGLTMDVGGSVIGNFTSSGFQLNNNISNIFGSSSEMRIGYNSSSASLRIGTNLTAGTFVSIEKTTGNVSINSTANTAYKLDVNGTGRFVGNAQFDAAITATGTITGSNLSGTNTGDDPLDLTQANTWTGQQSFNDYQLTDAATITWDLNTAQVAFVTLAGSRTLANPTNMIGGGVYTITISQDNIGTRSLTFGTNYKFPGGIVPTVSLAGNAVDIMTCISDGTSMFCDLTKDYK